MKRDKIIFVDRQERHGEFYEPNCANFLSTPFDLIAYNNEACCWLWGLTWPKLALIASMAGRQIRPMAERGIGIAPLGGAAAFGRRHARMLVRGNGCT
jgi:hypothetical protein